MGACDEQDLNPIFHGCKSGSTLACNPITTINTAVVLGLASQNQIGYCFEAPRV